MRAFIRTVKSPMICDMLHYPTRSLPDLPDVSRAHRDDQVPVAQLRPQILDDLVELSAGAGRAGRCA